jgi:hypothetical protein
MMTALSTNVETSCQRTIFVNRASFFYITHVTQDFFSLSIKLMITYLRTVLMLNAK